jgi:hypothetical protein
MTQTERRATIARFLRSVVPISADEAMGLAECVAPDVPCDCATLRDRLAEVERERDALDVESSRQRDRAKRAERTVEDVTHERDAAVAAERERCLAWATQSERQGRAIEGIESGAPAPREG